MFLVDIVKCSAERQLLRSQTMTPWTSQVLTPNLTLCRGVPPPRYMFEHHQRRPTTRADLWHRWTRRTCGADALSTSGCEHQTTVASACGARGRGRSPRRAALHNGGHRATRLSREFSMSRQWVFNLRACVAYAFNASRLQLLGGLRAGPAPRRRRRP